MQEREALVLGALFHDIGKLHQRTFSGKLNEIPAQEGEASFEEVHVRFTGNFIQSIVQPSFRPCLPFAIHHHHPQTQTEAMITVADQASGDPVGDDQTHGNLWLSPIFADVLYRKDNPLSHATRFAPSSRPLMISAKTLTGKKDFYPAPVQPGQAYGILWQRICDEMVHFQEKYTDFDAYLKALLFLLKKYTSTLPARVTVNGGETLPLFEHLQITAAIADALYRFFKEDPNVSRDEPVTESVLQTLKTKESLCLILGEVFFSEEACFHTPLDRLAVQRVAGQMFKRDLITESLCAEMERRLDLKAPARLWLNGNRFVLLAPRLPVIEQELATMGKDFNRWLLKPFQGTVSFASGYGVTSVEKIGEQARYVLAQAMTNLMQNRHRVWDHVFSSPEHLVFPALDGICSICDRDMEKSHPQEEICLDCQAAAHLGESIRNGVKLQKCRYTSESQDPTIKQAKAFHFNFGDVSVKWRLEETVDSNAQEVYFFNQTKMDWMKEVVSGFLFRPYAIVDQSLALLAEIAGLHTRGQISCSHFLPRVGIARLEISDVDQLAIFQLRKGSIAHITTLMSTLMSFFQSISLESHHISYFPTSHSGIWLIGPWNDVLEAMTKIRQEFLQFCPQQNVDLRGGAMIFPPEVPFWMAARQVLDRYEAACTALTPGITFAEGHMAWQDFSAVIAFGDVLADAVNRLGYRRLPRNILIELEDLWAHKNSPKAIPRFLMATLKGTHDPKISQELLHRFPSLLEKDLVPFLVNYITLKTGQLRIVHTRLKTGKRHQGRSLDEPRLEK